MARYIDEKDVYRLVEPSGTARVHCSQIDELPRADAVPKSEVEELKVRLELEQKAHESLKELYRIDTGALVESRIKTEVEVVREIFEEIDRMIYKVLNDRHYIVGDMCYEVAELKKKYTEIHDDRTAGT